MKYIYVNVGKISYYFLVFSFSPFVGGNRSHLQTGSDIGYAMSYVPPSPKAGVLNQGNFPPGGEWKGYRGGMEGPEKAILNISNTSIFKILSILYHFIYNPSMYIVSYMAHTEICHIIIKGVLQCILCLWRESDGWIKRVLNSFYCDSSVDDAA